MKILIIAHYFAPNNNIGSIRASKLAKYMTRLGHEVRVIAGTPEDNNLQIEIPIENIYYYKFYSGGISKHISILSNCTKLAIRVSREFRPDVIFSTSPPPHTLLAAMFTSKICRIPWVADFRDLWSLQYGNTRHRLRITIEKVLEKLVISTSHGITTISDGLKNVLASIHNSPIKIIPNGYDPDDFNVVSEEKQNIYDNTSEMVNLIYAGTIYEEKQDYECLLNVIAGQDDIRRNVQILLYGTRSAKLEKKISELSLNDRVFLLPRIPYKQIINEQKRSDALILFLWDEGNSERGVFPGKFFEYLATSRPVITIGSKGGDLAELIISQPQFTLCSTEDELASSLRKLVDEKRQRGKIPDISSDLKDQFRRDSQANELAYFLSEIRKSKLRGKP